MDNREPARNNRKYPLAQRSAMNSSLLSTTTRLGVALIFLAAAPQKIFAPAAFAQSVASYQILPDVALHFTALTLPWLEMLVAILLLCAVWVGPALFLANAMFGAFLAAVVSAHLRGLDIDCGCFSTSTGNSASMTWYIFRDVLFFCLGIAAAWLNRSSARHP